jgi:hypothetical protein
MKKSILILCSLLAAHYSLAQQVIYVDASNNTGIEDGSSAHPFNTINEGLSSVQQGYHISVAEGTYPEDTLMINHNISIQGKHRNSTLVEGIFILSHTLDTSTVSISQLTCSNVLMSNTNLAVAPLSVHDCRLQAFKNEISKLDSTVRLTFINNLVDDSIHLYTSLCLADIRVENCIVGSDFSFFSVSLRDGEVFFIGNHVSGNFTVSTVSKKDTLQIYNNQIQDSLVLLSIATCLDYITDNNIGEGVEMSSVSSQGFRFLNNKVSNGRLSLTYTAISNAEVASNEFPSGGIDLQAKSAGVTIRENTIHTDGQSGGIRITSTSGGYIENNIITLPYVAPTGISFENDSSAVCGVQVFSVSFPGMKGNRISGGSYGAYIRAVAAGEIVENTFEESHTGVYFSTASARFDSNRVEHCVADGLVADLYPEYDTSSVLLNYNLITKNGGHGIRSRGIVRMGKSDESGTGNNVMNNNDGFDLYIETPATLMDTIWAQNNEWSHATADEVGQLDIFDASDDPSKALVIYSPVLPFGISDHALSAIVLYPNPTRGRFKVQSSKFKIESVELVDTRSRVVVVLRDQRSGTETMELDIGYLPAGVYLCRITAANQLFTRKIVLIK